MTELEAIASGDAAAIIESVKATTAPQLLTTHPERGFAHYLVPSGTNVQLLDDERLALHPRRAKGIVPVGNVDALIDYVHRHINDHTTIWVHPTEGKVVAILNDHEPVVVNEPIIGDDAEEVGKHLRDGNAGWGDHRAVLDLIVTPEWRHWEGKDGQLNSQITFAEHIEDGLREITDPAPTILLEIAQTFHAKSDIAFRSANRLVDGQVQVQYDEETTASAGKSAQLDIPQQFDIAVAPFIGEPAYALTARLRYRLHSGKLSIGYKLDRPDAIVRDALAQIAARLRERFPGVVFIGTPRS